MLGGAGSAQWWAMNNGCQPQRTTTALPHLADDGTSVERWDYAECAAGSGFVFYKILGGGHTWPGAPLNLNLSRGLGRKSRDLDASRVMVDFFNGYSVAGAGW